MQKSKLMLLIAGIALTLPGLAMADGHCMLEKLNDGDDPTPMCTEPVDETRCATLAEEYGEASMGFASYDGGTYGEGACPTEGLVATCDKGDSKDHYYSDNLEGMEIGCGFSGGDWIEQ